VGLFVAALFPMHPHCWSDAAPAVAVKVRAEAVYSSGAGKVKEADKAVVM
jgi:hypothetical protein